MQIDTSAWNPPALPAKSARTLDSLAKYAMALADAIARVYLQASERPSFFPRSVQDVLEIVQTLYKDHTFPVLDWDGHEAGGIITGISIRTADHERTNSFALVDTSQSEAVRRYVECRLIIIGLPLLDALQTGHIADELRAEIGRILFEPQPSPVMPSTEIEFVAEIAAVEFLFPLNERLFATLDVAGGQPVEETAKKYGLPADVVQRYLAPHNLKFFRALNAQSML